MSLYLFDLDGTLISSYMDEPGRDYHTWHVLPGRREQLAQLLANGHVIGLVTNQAGVAFGYIGEFDALRKIELARDALGIHGCFFAVCFADARSKLPVYADPAQVARRKPSGAMIREAMTAHQVAAADVLYVGDRMEDEAAAAAAGVPFQWAADFFREA